MKAEFEIIGNDLYDITYACERHVGPLLGSPVEGPKNTLWTVRPLAEHEKETTDCCFVGCK